MRNAILLSTVLFSAFVAMSGASCGNENNNNNNNNGCNATHPNYDPLTGTCNVPNTNPPTDGTGGLPIEDGTTPPPNAGSGLPDGNVDLSAFGLNGRWLDNSNNRVTCITDDGSTVNARYAETFFCEHLDGTGNVSSTTTNFEATYSGSTRIEGTTSACYFGQNNPFGTGFKTESMGLNVSADGKTLTGTYFSEFDGQDLPLVFTRLTVGTCQ